MVFRLQVGLRNRNGSQGLNPYRRFNFIKGQNDRIFYELFNEFTVVYPNNGRGQNNRIAYNILNSSDFFQMRGNHSLNDIRINRNIGSVIGFFNAAQYDVFKLRIQRNNLYDAVFRKLSGDGSNLWRSTVMFPVSKGYSRGFSRQWWGASQSEVCAKALDWCNTYKGTIR